MQPNYPAEGSFKLALLLNFFWINVSEVARYFLVVRPQLHAAFPERPEIAQMDWVIFSIWGVWDLILILAATGFFWIWLERFGASIRQVILAASAFTVTVFGLLWLGVANMGLAPYSMIAVALPLAWLEQVIACGIVAWAMKRDQSSASMRSI